MIAQHEILRESFKRLIPKVDLFAGNFYELLFERNPETQQLFAGVRFDEQKKKLVRAVALVIRHVERPSFLGPYLQGLGAIHAAYDVKAEHYPLMGECFIEALAMTLGRAWTAEVEAAWRDAYAFIARTMLEGASRVQTDPACEPAATEEAALSELIGA